MLLYEASALDITRYDKKVDKNWILPFPFVYLSFKLTIYCALGGDVRSLLFLKSTL